SSEMLDGPGNPDGDVELRRHDLAGLADLVVVGDKPGIDRGARRADRGTQFVGDHFQKVEIVARLHTASAGDDDPGAGQLGTLRFRQLGPDELGEPGWSGRFDGLEDSSATYRLAWRKGRPAHRDDLDRILGLDRLQRISGID